MQLATIGLPTFALQFSIAASLVSASAVPHPASDNAKPMHPAKPGPNTTRFAESKMRRVRTFGCN
jgi:hypothetical protein